MSEGGGDIVIKKVKKVSHGGHHGGAWKIAYADFVTAMMAFFLLLWLLSTLPEEKLKGLSEYFTPTVGLYGQLGIGFEGGTQIAEKGTKQQVKSSPSIILGAPTSGAIVTMPEAKNAKVNQMDSKNFTSLKHDLYKAIYENPELKEYSESILIEQTPEGLRIQLLDNDKRPMFEVGTDILMEHTKIILSIVAKYIRYLPNYISIDGHTNSVASIDGENWRLSVLRADSTRKFLMQGHIDIEQLYRLVGKGDQDPIDKENPASPRNMRLSIILLKNSIVPYYKRVLPDENKLK